MQMHFINLEEQLESLGWWRWSLRLFHRLADPGPAEFHVFQRQGESHYGLTLHGQIKTIKKMFDKKFVTKAGRMVQPLYFDRFKRNAGFPKPWVAPHAKCKENQHSMRGWPPPQVWKMAWKWLSRPCPGLKIVIRRGTSLGNNSIMLLAARTVIFKRFSDPKFWHIFRNMTFRNPMGGGSMHDTVRP